VGSELYKGLPTFRTTGRDDFLGLFDSEVV